jgi:hypothetical protein
MLLLLTKVIYFLYNGYCFLVLANLQNFTEEKKTSLNNEMMDTYSFRMKLVGGNVNE